MIDMKKLEKKLSGYPNYKGVSKKLMPKYVDGRPTAVECVRIYVRKKISKDKLKKSELLPTKVDDTRTDVVEIGDVNAFQVDKTAKFDPIPLGVSVGHWSITAGSLGMLYKDKYNNTYAGSNAHVLTDDPTKPPDQISEKRICEPGPYHNPARDHLSGEYYWHDRILLPGQAPSDCAYGNTIVGLLNFFLTVLKKNSRIPPPVMVSEVYNYQDFAVYRPTIIHEGWIADNSFSPDLPFVGHLFAGSEVVGILCKAKYAIEKGFTPLADIIEVQLNDEVIGCSFWCNYKTRVIDTSAIIQVGGYGDVPAVFDDVILIHNDNVIKGGWSGSGWRKIMPTPEIIPDDMLP